MNKNPLAFPISDFTQFSWKIPFSEIGGLAFDLDDTLAYRGKEPSFEIFQALYQLLNKNLKLAFVTGSSFQNSLWPRVAIPFCKILSKKKVSPNLLKNIFFYGDGGAALGKLAYHRSGELILHLDEDSKSYMKKYAFSLEVKKKLPLLQKKIDLLISKWPREASFPKIIFTPEGFWLQPVELHSKNGQKNGQLLGDKLIKEGKKSEKKLQIILNFWGGRIEVQGKMDKENICQNLDFFPLSLPKVGLRKLKNIPTQILIKPVPTIEKRDLRGELLEQLPKILRELAFENVHSFRAGRTAIDILCNQCSKKTSLEHFSKKITGKILFFGDEFPDGNDQIALEVDSLFAISVGAPISSIAEKIDWLGHGPKGVEYLLKYLLEISPK